MPQKFGFPTTSLIIIILLLFFSGSSFATPWTPIEWQDNGKLRNWVRDQNKNFVDDLIEAQTGQMDVIVDLNQCPGEPATSQVVKYLNTKGDVVYVGKYVSFVIVSGVDGKEAIDIANRSEVAMVEFDAPLKWLDTERQAMKVEASSDYPNNLTKKGWPGPSLNGTGVNIAILDTGVNDSDPELTGRYRWGYNAITGQYENPVIAPADHGTSMAKIALGAGDAGIAPGAGLIDIKVGDPFYDPQKKEVIDPKGTYKVWLKALDTVIEKQKEWNIKVVNASGITHLPAPQDKNDGKDAVSWLVNRVVTSGIVVSAAAGGEQIHPPGTASEAITVGAADPGSTVKRDDDVIANSTFGPRVDDGDQDKMDELKPELAASSCCGTSPATARISGLAALLLQKAPDINPGSLKDLLIRTAEDIDKAADTTIKYPKNTPTWDKKWGFGLVDAYAAITNLQLPQASDLTFKGFDSSSHPSSPWYYSHAVETQSERDGKNIAGGVPDKIFARVYNDGSQPATNVRVNFAFYQFTAGISEFHDIGLVVIPTIQGKGDITTSIDWTPPKLPAGQEHGCILVTIDYGLDSSFSKMSNFAQKNVQVKSTASPAVFTFRVENTLPTAARIDLKVDTDHRDWNIKLSESSFTMTPYACARTIQATVEPPAGATPGTEALFFVSAHATPRGGEQSMEIGGVALKARFESKAAKPWPWDWLIIWISILVVLLLAYLYRMHRKRVAC